MPKPETTTTTIVRPETGEDGAEPFVHPRVVLVENLTEAAPFVAGHVAERARHGVAQVVMAGQVDALEAHEADARREMGIEVVPDRIVDGVARRRHRGRRAAVAHRPVARASMGADERERAGRKDDVGVGRADRGRVRQVGAIGHEVAVHRHDRRRERNADDTDVESGAAQDLPDGRGAKRTGAIGMLVENAEVHQRVRETQVGEKLETWLIEAEAVGRRGSHAVGRRPPARQRRGPHGSGCVGRSVSRCMTAPASSRRPKFGRRPSAVAGRMYSSDAPSSSNDLHMTGEGRDRLDGGNLGRNRRERAARSA